MSICNNTVKMVLGTVALITISVMTCAVLETYSDKKSTPNS